MTWPVVVRIVGGGSVCDVVESEVAADRLQGFEELFLAVEAAIRVVALVRLELDRAPRFRARMRASSCSDSGYAGELANTATARSPSSSSASFSSREESTPPEYATRTEDRSRTMARALSSLLASCRSSWIISSPED